jgi:phytoene dehydrogenase-like protein
VKLKTALKEPIQLPGDTYDFWKKAKEENRYDGEKQNIARQVTEAIEAQFPEAYGKIEVCDIATPFTYERFCGNWKGSWMTEIRADMRKEPYPPTIEGLGGVYFAGQRMMPPGGLPTALLTGQIAVQQLCEDMGVALVE